MRKTFLSILALLFTVGLAQAGWNIVQKDDGSTYWRDDAGTEVHVAETHLTVTLADVSTNSTAYVVAPVGGVVESVYATINATTASAAADLQVSIGNQDGWTLTTNGTVPWVIASGSTAGTVDTYTTSSSNTVTKGQVIAITTDGSSTNTVIATFTVVINPK